MARYGCGVTPTSRYVILGPDGSPVALPYTGETLMYQPFQAWQGCQNVYDLAEHVAAKLGGEVVALVWSTKGE
jgi:hypothetical protein